MVGGKVVRWSHSLVAAAPRKPTFAFLTALPKGIEEPNETRLREAAIPTASVLRLTSPALAPKM